MDDRPDVKRQFTVRDGLLVDCFPNGGCDRRSLTSLPGTGESEVGEQDATTAELTAALLDGDLGAVRSLGMRWNEAGVREVFARAMGTLPIERTSVLASSLAKIQSPEVHGLLESGLVRAEEAGNTKVACRISAAVLSLDAFHAHAAEVLHQAVSSEDEGIQFAALGTGRRLLWSGILSAEFQQLFDATLELFKESDGRLRLRAGQWICVQEWEDVSSVARQALLDGSDRRTCWDAVGLFLETPRPVYLRAIAQVLDWFPDWKLPRLTTIAAKELSPVLSRTEILDYLPVALEHEAPSIRLDAACFMLPRLEPRDTAPFVERALRTEPDEHIRVVLEGFAS